MSNSYHSTDYAHDLTKRNSSGGIGKLGASLFNATVDLNPHQLDAALFAFNSPLSSGAILADEEQDTIDERKGCYPDETAVRLQKNVTREEVFTIRWRVE